MDLENTYYNGSQLLFAVLNETFSSKQIFQRVQYMNLPKGGLLFFIVASGPQTQPAAILHTHAAVPRCLVVSLTSASHTSCSSYRLLRVLPSALHPRPTESESQDGPGNLHFTKCLS